MIKMLEYMDYLMQLLIIKVVCRNFACVRNFGRALIQKD